MTNTGEYTVSTDRVRMDIAVSVSTPCRGNTLSALCGFCEPAQVVYGRS